MTTKEAIVPDRRRPAPHWIGWSVWLVALGGLTGLMLLVRESLEKAHFALAYLLVVLGGSARHGRSLGFALAIVAFLTFNFFFIRPYHTFAIAAPADWLVLFTFLATAAVAAQLLATARSEAETARQRAAEVDRLATLGAETLNVAGAGEALAAIVAVIRDTLRADRCEIYLRPDTAESLTLITGAGDEPRTGAPPPSYAGAPLIEWIAANGRQAIVRDDGGIRIESAAGAPELADIAEARMILIPLRVRERTVGVLRIAHSRVLRLDRAQQRFLMTLSYYAALGAERVRLAAAADRVESLSRADRLKDALLASVSHDLRTPLTTIKALAHDIAAEGDDRAITIEEEADRLNRFVADLLDLSRLTGGALVVRPEINAAEDLLGAALQRVGGSTNGRVVNASLDPGEALLLGKFDFVHSLRALVNLIENACKYSPPGAAVDVTVRRNGDAVEFTVADRGPGVPTDERERIFEPFYKSTGVEPDVGGAGLGLSIARRLAEAQQGSVRYSPRDGGGSVFTLRLPLAEFNEVTSQAGLVHPERR
jgi:two-component system sensor histidine kinase KdpD